MGENNNQEEDLKKVHHRIKNDFATLISLVNLQMEGVKDPGVRQLLLGLNFRIRAVSLVHELIYRSDDTEHLSFAVYLDAITAVISRAFIHTGIRLNIDSDDWRVDMETAIPLGLIVSELISNAYHHAFTDHREGTIDVIFRHDPVSHSKTLTIRDDGIGLSELISPETATTVGLKIVNMLCAQLEGTLTVTRDNGTIFKLGLPR